jgi:hypothetical protein
MSTWFFQICCWTWYSFTFTWFFIDTGLILFIIESWHLSVMNSDTVLADVIPILYVETWLAVGVNIAPPLWSLIPEVTSSLLNNTKSKSCVCFCHIQRVDCICAMSFGQNNPRIIDWKMHGRIVVGWFTTLIIWEKASPLPIMVLEQMWPLLSEIFSLWTLSVW